MMICELMLTVLVHTHVLAWVPPSISAFILQAGVFIGTQMWRGLTFIGYRREEVVSHGSAAICGSTTQVLRLKSSRRIRKCRSGCWSACNAIQGAKMTV